MEQLLDSFVKYAESQDDIGGVILIGSYGRKERPADRWSDLDLLIITTRPEKYLDRSDWVGEIAVPVLTFVEKQATGEGRERRVLFEGGFDVDFSIESLNHWLKPDVSEEWLDIVRRGVRVLVNKNGTVNLPTVSTKRPIRKIPSQALFDELIDDFLYHALWTAKKLRRGELLIAQTCCNGYMKRILLRIMELQALAARGWDFDTWFAGRFVEEWADPKALRGLRTAHAYYDEKDVQRALLVSMDLFREIARETAPKLSLAYPEDKDNEVSAMVTEVLSK